MIKKLELNIYGSELQTHSRLDNFKNRQANILRSFTNNLFSIILSLDFNSSKQLLTGHVTLLYLTSDAQNSKVDKE